MLIKVIMIKESDNDLLYISHQLQKIRIFFNNEPKTHFYKDVVFNLITLKYLSDSFDDQFRSMSLNVPHLKSSNFSLRSELRATHSVIESLHRKGILWVRKESHWTFVFDFIQNSFTTSQPPGKITEYSTTSIAQVIDDALMGIENDNFLKQTIFNPISSYPIENTKIWEIVQLFNEVSFSSITTDTGTTIDKKMVLKLVCEECQKILKKQKS